MHNTFNLKGINNQLKNINCGGCGLFAYLLYKESKKQGFEANIHVIGYWANRRNIAKILSFYNTSDINEAINNVITKNYLTDFYKSMLPFWHIVVKINGQYYDSNGLYTSNVASEHTLDPEILKKAIKRYDIWNPVFRQNNSHYNFSKIFKIISKYLKNYFTNVQNSVK